MSNLSFERAKCKKLTARMVKEAMSYKFGGLEELGEKMCIVGELGKLLLEEIPLEETPPGYGRAPYEGYERTDKTAKEALRCLSQVQFHAASAAPKPPGLPGIHNSPLTAAAPGNGPVPEQSIAQREEYGDYVPGTGTGASSPHAPSSPPRIPAIAGLGEHRESEADEYGATTTAPAGTVWKGPSDDALEHSYEYEQQRQLDAAAQQAQEQTSSIAPTPYGAPIAERFATTNIDATEAEETAQPTPGWEPLRVSNRDSTGASVTSGPRYALHDGPVPRAEEEPAQAEHSGYADNAAHAPYDEKSESYLAAPSTSQRPVTADGYYTPDDESVVAIPEVPSPQPHQQHPQHQGIPPSTSADGLAYDDEPVVTIPDAPASPGGRRLPDPPTQSYSSTQYDTPGQYDQQGYNLYQQHQQPSAPGSAVGSAVGGTSGAAAVAGLGASDVPVVVIHDKPTPATPTETGYRPPVSPPRSRVASPDDALNQALDSYYTSNEDKRASYTPGPSSNGVMSAAAFRRGAKRPSFNEEDKPHVPDSPPPQYH